MYAFRHFQLWFHLLLIKLFQLPESEREASGAVCAARSLLPVEQLFSRVVGPRSAGSVRFHDDTKTSFAFSLFVLS